jgi:signal transduction histidine kinase
MLQWHSQIKYITDLKLVAGVGATIVDKNCFNRLSIDHRKILTQISTKYHSNLIKSIRSENELSNIQVNRIFEDSRGNLWFGTNTGIIKYDGNNLQNIPLSEELTIGFVESIFEDMNGGIWFLTTNEGVFRYLPPIKKSGPRIHMIQIEADKIYLDPLRKIAIPSTTNRITFEYKAISFKDHPEQLRHIYKLSGFDPDWNPSTSVTRVHYENLKPGDYQFFVKSFDNDLLYPLLPATVKFTIYHPLYKKPLFFIFILIFLLGLLFSTGYFGIQYTAQRRIALQYKEKLHIQHEMEQLQSAKMSSLRQLVAGVTHELNNPIGAISSSNDVSKRAIIKIKNMLNLEEFKNKNELKQILKTLSLLENVQKSSLEASDKVATIVENLRSFVKPDEAEWQRTNIHKGIDNAIYLLSTELNDKVVIVKNYADIPQIFCSPSSLNQVFICMLKNSIDVIKNNGEIHITTDSTKENIIITIEDNGIGIPAENLPRIFDPGFTSKGVKVGVGLGLSICYKIIVDEHKGHIEVTSELGSGTIFTITLPIQPKK